MSDIFDQIHTERTAAKNPTHPAGKVTGFEEKSGLPIVRMNPAQSSTAPKTNQKGDDGATEQPGAKPAAPETKPAGKIIPAGPSNLVKPVNPSDLAKGQPVQLADGSRGKVAHVVQNMNTARVRTDDGRNVVVRRSTLKPVLVKEHYRKAPEA